MMRLSTGATYWNWLLAVDRWIEYLSGGKITLAAPWTVLDNYDFRYDYSQDMLPSESAQSALNAMNGVGAA
jgi:hypothetical protein